MKNASYKKDRKQLSNSEVSKHKDFKSTLEKVNTSNFLSLKKMLSWGGVGIAGLALVISLVVINSDDSVETIPNIKKEQSSNTVVSVTKSDTIKNINESIINSPLKNYEKNYEVYSVDCSKDETITTKSGSVIFIPKHSLTDSSGNIIKGIAEIHYKEYRDQVDIFESGIPMEYDSAGTTYTFESAGMLDIKGKQNDKELKVAKDKSIDIAFNSTTEASGYNFYNLDKKTKKWNLENQPIPAWKPKSVKKDTKKRQETKEVTEVKKPKVPVKQNIKKYSLSVAVDNSTEVDLETYEGTVMEVNESKKKFDPILYNVQWESAELSESEIEGNYTLTLTRQETEIDLTVYPVVKDEYFEKAIAKYEKGLLEYKSFVENSSDFDIYADNSSTTTVKEQVSNNVIYDLMASNLIKPKITTRVFRLASFGVYNCDRPIVSTTQQPQLATNKGIETLDGLSPDIRNYYVSNPSRNAVVTLDKTKELFYYKRGKTVLWFVDKNGTIGIVAPEEFKKIDDLEHLTCSVYSEKQGIIELRKHFK